MWWVWFRSSTEGGIEESVAAEIAGFLGDNIDDIEDFLGDNIGDTEDLYVQLQLNEFSMWGV